MSISLSAVTGKFKNQLAWQEIGPYGPELIQHFGT